MEGITGIIGDSALPTADEADEAWAEYRAQSQGETLDRGEMKILPRLDQGTTYLTNSTILKAVVDLVYKEQTVSNCSIEKKGVIN